MIGIERAGTKRYRAFVERVEAAFQLPGQDIEPLLNGKAGFACFEKLSIACVRRLGAHFTPTATADRLAARVREGRWSECTVYDPCCGAGDLLLAVARQLPVLERVSDTVRAWNNRLLGTDISPEFIDAARLRIALLAAHRGARLDAAPTELASLLTNVQVADARVDNNKYKTATHILLNPPYSLTQVEEPWRSGQATAAASFTAKALEWSRKGTIVGAILPEVLRSGSSYSAWRHHVCSCARLRPPISLGRFSNTADIDVFIQVYESGGRTLRRVSARRGRTLGESCRIRVGPVVPHRNEKTGPERAYLHARNSPAWTVISRIRERLNYAGPLAKPPFVVVRRTSSPRDTHRAIATIVIGKRLVAVENHLIIIQPNAGGLSECRRIMRVLRSNPTTEQLNRTMRCRHLTVTSISALPLS